MGQKRLSLLFNFIILKRVFIYIWTYRKKVFQSDKEKVRRNKNILLVDDT